MSRVDSLPSLPADPEPDNLIVIEADGVTYRLRYEQFEAFVLGLPPYGPEQI